MFGINKKKTIRNLGRLLHRDPLLRYSWKTHLASSFKYEVTHGRELEGNKKIKLTYDELLDCADNAAEDFIRLLELGSLE